MTVRAPTYGPFVRRWQRPSQQLLAGDRLPSGRPPFDPFLTASLIWTTHLCPVAAIHDLLHGQPLQPREPFGVRSLLRGEHWHDYIARLRLRIASRRVSLPADVGHALEVVRHDFDDWVYQKRAPDSDVQRFWDQLVGPYVRTRMESGALPRIVGHALLPEVTVGNWQVEVPLRSGRRAYPIEARVDEIDLTEGVAIERTTFPLNQAVLYKDVQLAVAALVLRSLPAAGIPAEWEAVRRVRRFILEAPDGSVEVVPSARQFDAIHEAAAIIRDVAASPLSERPVRDLAQCSPVNRHDVCSHPYLACFYRVPRFYHARAAINREVRLLCRAELRELLWQRDLTKYRLYLESQADDRFPALPVEILRTARSRRGPFLEARLQRGSPPEYHQCALIIGSPHIGVRRFQVDFEEDPSSGDLRFYCDLEGLPLPNTGVLWPPIGEGLLLEGSFDFLIRQLQRDLFAHRKLGLSDPQQFQQESPLQLMDAIFGANPPLETS